MKAIEITFTVHADKGEIPFRMYRTNKPVKGKMFFLASKLNKENDVYFELYAISSAGADVVTKSTLSMTEFTTAVEKLRADIQKADASVELLEHIQGNGAIMVNESTSEVTELTNPEQIKEVLEDLMKDGPKPLKLDGGIQSPSNRISKYLH